ncbi:MAG TPA: methionine biosynthesis protein MetW [Candidatus Paceibacterota bacterium]|nr:methionine biosynthesis protein MetW [Candidatus Paceibacterota bacterium]
MDVKAFENRRWSGEDQAIQFRHRAALDLVPRGTVLDLGSGDGLLLSLLWKKKAITGKGLDLSEEGVKKANAKGLDTRVYDFGLNKLPFAEGSFDTVTLLDILEHLYDPGSVLKEAARVAKKNVVVGVPNFSSLPARLQVLLGRIPENNQPKKGHVYWFNKKALEKIAADAGLRLVELHTNTLFERVPVVGTITRLKARFWPSLFALSFVAKFEKRGN